MKRDLWDAEHKCTKYNHLMKKKLVTMEGMAVRSWECLKCSEVVLHPEDAQKMLTLNKMRKGVSVKIGELGSSLVVRIPKELVSIYNLSKGEEIKIKVFNDKKMELELAA